ncbi:phosphotransferase family protein [Luteimicrobium subarcticum]|uniref:Aminoglycoside phosphotransferase (APT) family kinase protein n=1 Tax=Luteimicrobium subarcticum TaxID=620910 RepID=A0A2M8W6P8_9MICO|nr:phosphotransferase [Luteimicrobium subarcticum]PJI86607.1 aminoglycoside phosphotransferase (APT) family kinase protein [Luteimicrobium subarcticum]
MESITKNRQTYDTLAAMVERAYGPDAVPTEPDGWADELGHGWFNVAYRIRLRDGRDVVLKIAPPPGVEVMTYEHGAMGIELASLAMITAQTDVPVPPVHVADTSCELVDAPYFFMPFVDGDNLGIVKDTLDPAVREDCMEQLGTANRELNSIRGDWFGPVAGPGHTTWRAAFGQIMDDVLADGERRRVDIGHSYDDVRAVVAAHADALDAVTEPRFVEWDLWDSNVMVRDGKIACIIDHERALYGDPLMEAGFVGTQLPAFGDPAPFVRGYGWGELTENETVRRRLYCLHLVLIMVIETVYRGHTDTQQYDWARGQLDETLALLGHGAA